MNIFKKKTILEYSMKLVVVAFVAAILSNIIVWVSKTLTSSWAGKWSSVLVGVFALVLLVWSMKIRPGKEDIFDLVTILLGVNVIFGILSALGVPFFSYVTDISTPVGIGITAATIFLAEAIYLLVKRKI